MTSARSGRVRRGVRSVLTTPRRRRWALVGRPELWTMKRRFQIEFLLQHGLEPQHRLLDLGCGVLRGGVPIIEHLDEGNYLGVDVRANVLDEARAELAAAALEHKHPVLVHTDDLGTLELERTFDFVWAFSVLIHMSDDVLAGALGFAARHLATDGTFFANVNIGGREDGSWQGFPVVCRSWEFYRERFAAAGLHVEDLGRLESFGHRSPVPRQNDGRMVRAVRATT